MIMETMSCGYPVAPSGLGASPISPSSSPTDSDAYAPQLYAPTPFAQPSYSGPYSKYEEDHNNNNHLYGSADALNNNREDSLLSDLSSLSISESEDRFPGQSPVSETSDYLSQMSATPPSSESSSTSFPSTRAKAKKSRTKSQSSQPEERKDRKDSFVYDVRLPDEQFLFFVPDLDLVKSHLMFAVREEVDVLKDRIVELMDRIKHLECENTILRQYASPEVLQQLQTQMPLPMQQAAHHTSTS